MNMKWNMKGNQANFFLGLNLRVLLLKVFKKKNGIVGNCTQWREKNSWDPIFGNIDCEIFWTVEEFQKEV